MRTTTPMALLREVLRPDLGLGRVVFAAPGLGRIVFAAVAVALVCVPAAAQMRALPPADAPAAQLTPIRPGSPGSTIVSPDQAPARSPLSVAPPAAAFPGAPAQAVQVPAGQVALMANARFSRDQQPISGALLWRVYTARPDGTGAFRPLREDRGASPTFLLPPGQYVVHVSFGMASAVKPVTLRGETVRETFELPAGGVRLEGRVGDARIPQAQVAFDLYPGSQFDPRDRQPIAQNIETGEVVIVPEGTYYVVSNYGDSNAIVRSDIRVQSGKLTDVRVTHRAAVITLKLVGEQGGEALANTSWTVLTPGGDVVREMTGAFPRVVLAEGEYRAIARYEGLNFERPFNVVTGGDGEIEVVAK